MEGSMGIEGAVREDGEPHRLVVAARHWGVPGAAGVRVPAGSNVLAVWEALSRGAGMTLEKLADVMAARLHLERADLAQLLPAGAVSPELAPLETRYGVRVLDDDGRKLRVATADPLDPDVQQALSFAAGRRVALEIASPLLLGLNQERESGSVELDGILETFRDGSNAHGVEIEEEADPEEIVIGEVSSEPIVRLADAILQEAVNQNASDVHLEPAEERGVIRFRVDGVLRPHMNLPLAAFNRLVSRFKIMGGMDIANRVRPQDGQVRIRVDGRRYELRLSTVPTMDAEKAVIRLAGWGEDQHLEQLEIPGPEMGQIRRLLANRDGLIIVTGPTGSGKTTTLYAALHEVNTGDVNIVTVEDPVERSLPGATQIQVQPRRGVTFASALRAVLRQDPDVILVGEIRDLETAEIALQAAMTGHLVLTTLHTTTAVGAVARLRELGVDGSTLAATLRGVVAQRLARKVCTSCAGSGCAACEQTGLRGRIPLMEVVVADAGFIHGVGTGALPARLKNLALKSGMRSIHEVAKERVARGETTSEEVLRVLGDAEEHLGASEAFDAEPLEGESLHVEPLRDDVYDFLGLAEPLAEGSYEPWERHRDSHSEPRVVRTSPGDEPAGAAVTRGDLGIEEDLARAGDLDSVLGPASVSMADLLDAPMVWGGILDGATLGVRVLSDICLGAFGTGKRGEGAVELEGVGGGLLQRAIDTGLPQAGALADQPGLDRLRENARSFGLEGFLVVPLVSEGRTVGVVGVHTTVPVQEKRLLEGAGRLGHSVGTALSRVRDLGAVQLQLAALDATADAVVIADRDGVIQWVNRAFTELSGYEASEAVGRTTEFLRPAGHDAGVYSEMSDTVLSGHSWRGELMTLRKDGSERPVEQTVTPVLEGGLPTSFIAVQRDISARKERETTVARLLTQDSETGLPNARQMIDRLKGAVQSAREGRGASLLIAHLEQETPEGEPQADGARGEILREVGEFLVRSLGPDTFVARLSLDEFGAILPETNLDGARAVARQVQEEAQGLTLPGGESLRLRLGAAPVDGTRTARSVLALAEAELESTPQRAGSQAGTVSIADDGSPLSAESIAWTDRIRAALEGDLFTLHFQPVVRLSTGRVEHYSSLLRLYEEDGTVIPASAFIGHAEKAALIPEVDRWVVQQAIGLLYASPELRLSVNVSWATLTDLGFRAALVRQRASLQATADRLILEVSAPEGIGALARCVALVDELEELGLQFALDNVGLDRDAVMALGALPARWLKLDGALVRGIDTDPDRRALVGAFVEVAQALGPEVIAGRAETSEVVGVLPLLGIDLAEGHQLGGPSGGRAWTSEAAEVPLAM